MDGEHPLDHWSDLYAQTATVVSGAGEEGVLVVGLLLLLLLLLLGGGGGGGGGTVAPPRQPLIYPSFLELPTVASFLE